MEKIFERAADTAKKIRKALKEEFPGVKFSVRSKTFSGGDSVSVHWTDGPTQKQVDAVLNRFQSGHFDGMQDLYISGCYEYEGKLYCGAKYVHGQRSLSDEYRARLEEKAADMFEDFDKNSWRYHEWIMKAEDALNDTLGIEAYWTEDIEPVESETVEPMKATEPEVIEPEQENAKRIAEVIDLSSYRAQSWYDNLTPEQHLKLSVLTEFIPPEEISVAIAHHISVDQLFKVTAEVIYEIKKKKPLA